MTMFCYQCEQKSNDKACTAYGACGKEPNVAKLQDLLLYALEGVSQYAHRARLFGVVDKEVNHFTIEALFTTVTNVDFDQGKIASLLNQAVRVKDKVKKLYEDACAKKDQVAEKLSGPAKWQLPSDLNDMLKQAGEIGIEKRIAADGADIVGLQELVTYGIKGTSAYVDHAKVLGFEDDRIYAFFHEALDLIAQNPKDANLLTEYALKTGQINLIAMELLDAANTGKYGHPEPTRVRITPVKGKAILVSGHDLKDLEEILKQTEGKGINVYTHGEMLPCNAYPSLKKYRHLVGNYGGAWQEQQKEFAQFPGAIVMTTNCIQRPKNDYKDRIFTSGLVGWPGVAHIKDGNFAPAIKAALDAPGFDKDEPEKFITVGFARNAVMGVASKVIDAVKAGKIRHFFLIGGCDGARPGRNYYTEFAEKVPNDCVILTLACGKFRFNKLEFGDIGGIPRLLDMGQCNDAYSAIQVAVALAKAFDTDVNRLPLSLILSWYEQKAVAILLTLLHLGIKNIRIGPSLPAFITSNVLNVLVEKFDIKHITSAEQDLRVILK